MEGFRIILIIIGAIAIGAILIHGLWSIRKQNSNHRIHQGDVGVPDVASGAESSSVSDGFDQDGIGKVRVLGSADDESIQQQSIPTDAALQSDVEQRVEPGIAVSGAGNAGFTEASIKAEKVEPSFTVPKVSSEPTSAPELTEQVDLFAEPVEEVAEIKPESQPSSAAIDKPAANEAAQAPAADDEPLGEPQDVLVLNVVAGPSGTLEGAVMLPCLLTLGLKFGEMSIFHRHQSPAGTGPILFSLANMVKPGTFDPESMESFNTQGISLFMTLPCYGEAQKNFGLMLKAAEQLAAEMRGQVLDDQRNVLTKQKIQHYQERIREFERKKLLSV
ncbi:cell division protein ZipA [Corallincola luteus]|uniref:Cell division protein ZipA n=2 Tax=Corallincola TaxID=1775176 RepID=A0A368NKK6_9GAMM|nr:MULTISPECIES: cell division protein ZipA [Corallincola]RCU50305.1 cell division protein ZipA [Corallincola holothuriorum]TCI05458.1 cell division protein ZipA [Corallincola luteus]